MSTFGGGCKLEQKKTVTSTKYGNSKLVYLPVKDRPEYSLPPVVFFAMLLLAFLMFMCCPLLITALFVFVLKALCALLANSTRNKHNIRIIICQKSSCLLA